MSDNRDDDRFGMPESAFNAARDAHQEFSLKGIARMGMYVPTRFEVRTMPVRDLEWIIDLWLGESPVELIPSDQQILDVIYELQQRTDHNDQSVKALIHLCRSYIGMP